MNEKSGGQGDNIIDQRPKGLIPTIFPDAAHWPCPRNEVQAASTQIAYSVDWGTAVQEAVEFEQGET